MHLSDRIVLELLERGEIETDPSSGDVWVRGRLAATRNCGYLQTYLERGVSAVAHRIMWIANRGEIPDGTEINHRNRVRDDNRLVNLEVVTRTENVQHALGHWGYRGVRPEDVANASPEFVAALCKALSVEWTDDPTLLARALQDADSTTVEPPEHHSQTDHHVTRDPAGDWVHEVQFGVRISSTLTRVA